MKADDPIFLLENEHRTLLGQLRLLEKNEVSNKQAAAVLRTLIRDAQVHFSREALLFRTLGTKLGKGGEGLHALTEEHREISHRAETLRKDLERPLGDMEFQKNVRRRLQEFTKQFQVHIHHEEKVVYLLARTRLSHEQQQKVGMKMLLV